MIELFKQLRFQINKTGFELIRHELNTSVCAPWSYLGERDLVPNFESLIRAGVTNGIIISFGSRNGALPDADLSLAWSAGKAWIGNIVPLGQDHLTKTQYNQLFDDFFDKHLKSAIINQNVQIAMTDAFRDISEWIDADAKHLLDGFSTLANKGSAASHPEDRQRWLKFVIAAHRAGARLPSEVLEQWLVDELHWPNSIASELAIDFRKAIEVLDLNDAA